MTPNEQIRLGVDARHAIERAGGLVAQADLARRWHLSPPRVLELVRHPDFPAAVGRVASRCDVWLAAEADAWRERRAA